jgi:hypothetical protein
MHDHQVPTREARGVRVVATRLTHTFDEDDPLGRDLVDGVGHLKRHEALDHVVVPRCFIMLLVL